MKNIIRKIAEVILFQFAKLIKQLPPKASAFYLEKLQFFEKLDYQATTLFIKITNTNSLTRLNSCRKEAETVLWMEEMAQKYSVIYDIGANVGAYSLIGGALLSAKGGILYAFEPVSSNFNELCENIKFNGLIKNIVPVNIALSNVSSLDYFEINQLASGSAMHKGLSKRDENAQQKITNEKFGFLVNKMRLDEFVKSSNIHFPECIKIDVDGHEMEVLSGASETLADPRCKSIIFEIDEQDPITPNIRTYIEDKGFFLQKKNYHKGTVAIYDLVYSK